MKKILPALALWTIAGSAMAQTITVDITDDTSDFSSPHEFAQLPGPDGLISFREAIAAANNTPGAQTIAFAIPKDQWWLLQDMAILKLENGAFILTDDHTTIDFTTQTDFTGDTNPDGPEVGIYGLEPNGWGSPAIIVDGSFCTLRGLGAVWLRGASVAIWDGHDNRVVGCKTGLVEINGSFEGTTVTGNIIGGTTPDDANDLGSVVIVCGADDNIVVGNALRTIAVSGGLYCDFPARNRIGGPTPQERNVINGFGTFGEEGFPYGAGISISGAKDTVVEGNYIGVTADGMDRVLNWTSGIEVADSINTTIRNNLISGLWVEGTDHYSGQLFGQAILLTAINLDNVGVTIEGNQIGTDATGQNPILTLYGISVAPFGEGHQTRDVRIGGTEPGQGNLIAFTERTGVSVWWPARGSEISGNSIHSNGLLGIDLAPLYQDFDGVTLNDPSDEDTGGNNLQNFPVLSTAVTDGGTTMVTGNLDSTPNLSFTVELFSSPTCDPSGYGEGKVFLGSTTVTTDGAGHADFQVPVDAANPGEAITATDTDQSTGDTSEFSACISAEVGDACYADFSGDGALDLFDFLAFVNSFNAADPAADCIDDNTFDLFDFLCFVNAFNAGC